MKRFITIAIALALLFALCACGGESEPVASAAPSDAALPSETVSPVLEAEPETSDATVLIDRLGAVFKILEDGEALQITGENGEYYLFECEGVKLMAEKRLIRLASDAPFEEWTGYTAWGTTIYEDVYFSGEALETLTVNTEVSVIDDFENCLKLRLEDGRVVFAKTEKITRYRSVYSNDGGGGGGDGEGSTDGSDIDISSIARRTVAEKAPVAVLLSAETKPVYPTAGTVIVDGAEAYLGVFNRGDAVKLTEKDDATAKLLIDGKTGTVPAIFLRMDGEKEFEAWDGYVKTDTEAFGDWRMKADAQAIGVNSPLLVLEDFGEFCYIQWQQGHSFILKEEITATPILRWDSYSGGSSGSEQWTAPIK